MRYSNDLDYFNNSLERVAKAFNEDRTLLEKNGFQVETDIQQPGYLRARVGKGKQITKIEWAQDSAWPFFLPIIKHKLSGFQLHPIDLATNKVLALVGRNEVRDFLDVIYVIENVLSLGALCWAAAGKDPGFTPLSLLELLKRKGAYRPEEFERLNLRKPVDLIELKQKWLGFLEQAEVFIKSRPSDELGCLYYNEQSKTFFTPDSKKSSSYQCHYGRPGGILPKLIDR